MCDYGLCTCYGGNAYCNKAHSMDPYILQFGQYPTYTWSQCYESVPSPRKPKFPSYSQRLIAAKNA